MGPTDTAPSPTVAADLQHTAVPVSPARSAMAPRARAAWSPLYWLLPLALLHGLLYLVLAPPWQHYDEPTHFEYVRLIALLNRQPGLTDADLQTNREVADSMYRFRFYPPGQQPLLIGPEPPVLGVSQKVHPPLYYALAALPVRWLMGLSVETQLYAARLLSVGLYLLTVLCAWRLSVLLAPDQPLLHLALPLLTLTVPAYADIMSAVNNDVLVNFAAATLLIACVLLIRDGLRPVPLLLALLSLGVGLFAKRTAVVGLAPLLLALFWAVRRNPVSWRIWLPGGLGLVLLGGFAAFRLDPPGTGAYDSGWLAARPWLVAFDQRYLRLNIDVMIHSLTAWERSWYVYPIFFQIGFFSFWQHFGWGGVLMPRFWDWATLTVFVVGSAGLLFQGFRGRRALARWQQRCIWLFLLVVLLAWAAMIIRLHPLPPPGVWIYYPRGRYMHFALLPTLWLLLLGFQGLVPRRWQTYAALALIGFFVALDTAAWAYTLITKFYG